MLASRLILAASLVCAFALARGEQIYASEQCRQESAVLGLEAERIGAEASAALDQAGPSTGYGSLNSDLKRLVARSRDQGHRHCLAEFLRLTWHVRFQQNDLGSSKALLIEALQQFEPEERLSRQRNLVLGNLSYHQVMTGQFVEATQIIREMIAISIELQDADALAANYYLIADAYLKLGEIETAKRYFQYSIDPYTPSDGMDYYTGFSKLATIDRIQGSYARALQRHSQSLGYFQSEQSYRRIPARIEIARDHLAMGNHESAEQFANLAWNDSSAMLEQRIDAGLVLFDSASRQRNQSEAERLRLALSELLNQAQAHSGQRNANIIQELEYMTISARHFAARNELTKVLEVADETILLTQRISADVSRSGVNAMAWASRVDGIAQELAGYLWDKKPIDLAQWIDRLQSQSEKSNDQGSLGGQEFELLEELSKLERRLVDQQGLRTSDPVRLEQEMRMLAQSRDAVREAYVQVHTKRMVTKPMPARQYRSASTVAFVPAKDEILIRYYVRPSISIAFVYSDRSVVAVPVPPLSLISQMVDRAKQVIRDPGSPDVRPALRALAALLPLAQIRASDVRRILLVTDESTFSTPFSAIDLSDGKQLYRPLGAAFELVEVSHLESYGQADQRQSTASPGIAIFASPALSSVASRSSDGATKGWLHNLPKLDFSLAEAMVLRGLFADRPSHFYVGTEATAENLLSEQARSARILHISTHGYFRPDLAHVVGLAVAGSAKDAQQASFVTQSQLLSQPFHNALIVLGSCDSLQGQRYRGIGSYGLGQALIEQGTPVVVGTLWAIPDASAANFMTRFYRHLIASEGDSGYAMTQARSEMIMDRAYAHPRHWAAMTLLSRNREIERKLLPASPGVLSDRLEMNSVGKRQKLRVSKMMN
ncbi:hypothetical protein C7S18_10265 [Ahniella affigens]|uniref:CHAT domain-containing protein n=1 Tax=Ahniella affigens TaxID=2021234 RepID=A0A2P1PRV4_9GAMM|nr:CHAT domain-containing protein [Ahniella affigens]AVP97555.1 hypothetical protein C7S18_10265 [Ahniella affigens]